MATILAELAHPHSLFGFAYQGQDFLVVVLVCYVLDKAHFNCLPSEKALPTVFPN